MTNHDILKEYEAHKIPVPSYEEYKKLKELLKECRETIETSVWGNCSALTDQIDNAIGEKKCTLL